MPPHLSISLTNGQLIQSSNLSECLYAINQLQDCSGPYFELNLDNYEFHIPHRSICFISYSNQLAEAYKERTNLPIYYTIS